ncbi:MAG: segregation/condensation protein A [Actinomycetota bacterium]
MSYAVKLDVYEGPLDLLLQLISKERVNVADVSIARVTEEYLRAVRDLGEADLETASSFLVLAATLLELKSLKLLPKRSTEDPEIKLLLEERDRLLHRLIVYASFKQMASELADRLEANAGFYSRSAELPEELIPAAPDPLRALTSKKLAQAAARVFAPPEEETVDLSHVTPMKLSLEEMIDTLKERMRRRRQSTFRALCSASTSRIDVVVSLLAVLELSKHKVIEIDQEEPFAEISLKWVAADE